MARPASEYLAQGRACENTGSKVILGGVDAPVCQIELAEVDLQQRVGAVPPPKLEAQRGRPVLAVLVFRRRAATRRDAPAGGSSSSQIPSVPGLGASTRSGSCTPRRPIEGHPGHGLSGGADQVHQEAVRHRFPSATRRYVLAEVHRRTGYRIGGRVGHPEAVGERSESPGTDFAAYVDSRRQRGALAG